MMLTFHFPINSPIDLFPLPPAKAPRPAGTPNKDDHPLKLQAKPAKQPAMKQVWGVYDSSMNPVFDVDTCVSVHPENINRISNYPVEKGAFTDYNKVGTPKTCRVRLGVGGAERIKALLVKLDSVSSDTNLYSIATPEKTFQSMNLEKWSYSRDASSGQNLLHVDLTFIEVRLAQTAYSSATVTQNAPAAHAKAKPTVNAGNVQPSQLDAVNTAINTSNNDATLNTLKNLKSTLQHGGTLTEPQMKWVQGVTPGGSFGTSGGW